MDALMNEIFTGLSVLIYEIGRIFIPALPTVIGGISTKSTSSEDEVKVKG